MTEEQIEERVREAYLRGVEDGRKQVERERRYIRTELAQSNERESGPGLPWI